MLETRLLQQFIAVAEELHFSRAAERLHMAQPPLSQAIRRLESELETPLFLRTKRSVALTPAGTAFLEKARSILQSLDESVAHTRRVAQGLDGRLTLVFIHITPYATLLRALRQFRAASPGVAFEMKEATTREQIEALENGTADIGFMRTPGMSTPTLCFETVAREPIWVALPAGHRLVDHASIELALLKDEDFVTSPRPLGPGFHDQIVRLCQAVGFQPRVVQHARKLQTLIALVASGFGIALIPASLTHEARDDIVFRPVTAAGSEHLLQLELLMAWNGLQASPLRDRLIEEIRKLITQP